VDKDELDPQTHPVTLRFTDSALEAEYLAEFARAGARHFRVIMPLGFLIYLAPGLLIDLRNPAGFSTVLAIRLAAAPLLLAACALGWAPPRLFARCWQGAMAAAITVIMLSVAAMIFGAPRSPLSPFRVMGIAIVILGGHTILLLRHGHATVAGALATIGFLAGGIAAHTFSGLELTMSGIYLAIANVLGFFGSRAFERYRRRDFVQRRLIDRERARSERLLLNVLPEPIARRLKARPGAIADRFPEVTVLFGDIVGFTQLAHALPPEQLVAALDGVFSQFDDLAEQLGLEKIKTIGDAYMVVGGLPTERADHAEAAAEMALGMRARLEATEFAGGRKLEMRIGIHTGPAVAGVIGKRKFSYDLWGDTVNTASRMESHGVAGAIQVSEATRAKLEGRYRLEPRGVVDVKGKGAMETWLLVGRAESLTAR
jgi:class 3 adenylate cyclase